VLFRSLEIRDVLVRLRAAGMDSLPGGGAEILHEETLPAS